MDARLQVAVAQIQSARDYLHWLLADVPDSQWFYMPPGWPTHIAWQVGHLAMAEYGLCLFRQRGRAEGDVELMPSSFRKQFSRGSSPEPDPAKNPTPATLREILGRVHEQVLREAPSFTAEQLAEPVGMPYAGEATKFGALLFCAHHEMLHAGQVGALKRFIAASGS